MTSPIKPPGGPTPPLGPADATRPSDPEAAEGFREALEVGSAAPAQGSNEVSGVDAVVADLQAKKIDAAEAVDRLVAEVMQGPMASMLDAAGRSELEAHLRATLEDDPNLQALIRDLDS